MLFVFLFCFVLLFFCCCCCFLSKDDFIIFISFFDEVSSFLNKVLPNQKPEKIGDRNLSVELYEYQELFIQWNVSYNNF